MQKKHQYLSLKIKLWQERFKSQAVLDMGAMAYVDLNPIRASFVLTLETSEFTFIYERIKMISWQLNLKNNTKKEHPDIKRI